MKCFEFFLFRQYSNEKEHFKVECYESIIFSLLFLIIIGIFKQREQIPIKKILVEEKKKKENGNKLIN